MSGGAGQLFIYRVQNGKATDLATVLNDLFQNEEQAATAAHRDRARPRLQPPPRHSRPTRREPLPRSHRRPPQPRRPKPAEFSINGESKVRIIADEPNNTLLILASAQEYRQILGALRQLDITPMQVLIEVTIAEVTLTDNLSHGVEWFFKNGLGGNLVGTGTLDLGTAGIAAIAPGFSWAIQGAGSNVQGVLNLLANESNLSIISSPPSWC